VAFKRYIFNLLTHRNPYTNLRYCDDPTILAWETGNELGSQIFSLAFPFFQFPPPNWTEDIACYIKSIAPRHLVIDGTYGVIWNPTTYLALTHVDIVSDHFYPLNVTRLQADALGAFLGGKVFFAGEFQWNVNPNNLPEFICALEESVDMDAYWSFFPHADNFGFVQHGDGETLHYPGDNSQLEGWVSELRTHAYKVSGTSPLPSHRTPAAPEITSLKAGNMSAPSEIAWRGASVASNYSVEQSSSGNSLWSVIYQGATDNQTPLRSPNITITLGSYYRVRGFNLDGNPGPFSLVLQCN